MSKKFYVQDNYFDKYMSKYFNDINWKRSKKFNSTFNHNTKENLCNKCKYTNRFISLNPLDNKGSIYNDFSKKSYVVNFFRFDNKNDLSIYKHLFEPNKYWLFKPEISRRQLGILITDNYNDVLIHLNNNKQFKSWVGMTYISNPLLYKSKKMHLRVYVLLIKNKNFFRCYMYNNGYMYIADNKYKLSDYNNPKIHITTSCNNKEFPYEFDNYYGNDIFKKKIFPQLREIVYDTVNKYSHTFICPNESMNNFTCYKQLGYDILLDENFKAYLLEINTGNIGMASYDKEGNCVSNKPSLHTPKFKKKYIFNVLNLLFDKEFENFTLILKKKITRQENFTLSIKNYNNFPNLFFIFIIFICIVLSYKN